MKKLFTLVAMALMAVGANAQTLVASQDWTGGFEGDYPMWAQFADGQDGNVASDAEGVAITVGSQTGELWQPQVQVLQGATLEEDHSYVVKVTAKFPTNGTLQINMGNWGGRDQYTVDVESTGDFQEVEIEFPDYAYVVEGDGFVLFQCGDFKGTTIVKKVEIWDVTGGEGSGETVIGEQDWTGGFEGDYPMWAQFADGQEGNVASDPEGVAITVGTQTGELWQPQVQVMQGLTLEEDHSYKVVVTAKFPSNGTLQINMGNWGGRDQYTVDVEATGDFQDVEVEFPDYAYVVEGDGFVLFQCGDFKGTTIVKKIQVIDMTGGGEEEGEAVLVASKDWNGGFEGDYPMWAQFADGQEGNVASDAEGVAITVGTQTGELWQPQVQILNEGLTLEEDHSYVVKVTAKFPSNGTLQINMGNWGGRDQYTVDVEATGDFQEVEVEFPDYAYVVEGDGFVLFQCGDFKGTTIVKKVEVWDVTNGPINAIKAVKTFQPASTAIYNLKGQKVDASYKGIVIKDGKKYLQK